ncbi:cupin domain-containing protein [Muriicola sp. Z0-33]|uniref:cupin domain-containing protein n=1 Tax=Muriicola sp. Z0-33 TaxID=2816957 RepID=UPI002238632B|nr:cupin domain-containing protein [Muriicola sp. Z0-33]MCW5516941.1 cupin domain-containing protein [Muriicola sp. Z0-33]
MKKSNINFTILIFTIFHFTVHAQKKFTEVKMPSVNIISAVDVEEKIDGQPARVSTVELILQPKEESQPHRHPGPVYGYVLEGIYKFKIEGHPERTLRPGDTFYEPLMALHEVGTNPSNNSITRVLAVVVHPRNAKRLVIPESPVE